MQSSWRLDHDKLTFIICEPPPNSTTTFPTSITPGVQDSPNRLIGDVNLFLSEDSDSDDDADVEAAETGRMRGVVGELEIMIAEKDARGKSIAYTSLLTFLSYIIDNLASILVEYSDGQSPRPGLKYLRVKIGQDNERSLRLFERLGFKQVGEGANYFGEVEMRMGVREVHVLVMQAGAEVKELRYHDAE
jgi:RimJ/RimL family protein N-acetyltransferase